ncbi:hypothetical protein B0O99DRAFT_676667 [Bisporella sp. PMI_857]|nr:hypothetical protein B0O99DRAFT_676667 [Bisporella sp. PMI_857]
MSTTSVRFNLAKDIPPLDGKIILITGGNKGIGRQAVIDLSKHNPSQIWIAARDIQQAEALIAEIHQNVSGGFINFLELDLGSFDSVKKAARKFLASVSRLDLLILNSGIMGGPHATTAEGYEIRFGVNHMGHALFLKLLIPILQSTASRTSAAYVRTIILSSNAYKSASAKGIEFETLKSKQENVAVLTQYCQSKLANLLYAQELAKHYPQFTTVSIHPGAVQTDLFKPNAGLLMFIIKTVFLPFIGEKVENGTKNLLWAATASDVVSGEYYEPVGLAGKGVGLAKDQKLARKLWDWTEKELEGQGS